MNLKDREYKNVKTVQVSEIDIDMNICFTYTIQPNLKIEYTTNRGVSKKRYYKTLPFLAQKEFLIKGIKQLKSIAYYFERHKDGRYHIHAYCFDTPRNYLQYAKERYIDTKIESKSDIQDFCLLGEIVGYKPAWVNYCLKEQTEKDIYIGDIENYLNGKLDEGVIKIEYNYKDNPPIELAPACERDFDNYLHKLRKKFLIEI